MRTMALIWTFVLIFGATAGCQGGQATAGEGEGEEQEDPMAPCRQYLGGTWRVMGATVTIEGDSGAAVLRYEQSVHAGLIQVRACREDGASVHAEGYDAEVRFDGPNRMTGTVAGYPSATLVRVVE